jgi:hypothetical protein
MAKGFAKILQFRNTAASYHLVFFAKDVSQPIIQSSGKLTFFV